MTPRRLSHRYVLLAAFLLATSALLFAVPTAFATAPPSGPETFQPTISFDTTVSPIEVAALNSAPFFSTAWWGRATSNRHAGVGALWCAATRPSGTVLTVTTYPVGTWGTAKLAAPQLANAYSSKLSFWYAMPSRGFADAESFRVQWSRTDLGTVINQVDLNIPVTPSFATVTGGWVSRQYSLADPGNSVNLSRRPGRIAWDFLDFTEGPLETPQVGTGPVIDDVIVTGYTYGPVRNLAASLTMNPSYTVSLSWSRPASSTTDARDDARPKSYRVWREEIGTGSLQELTRFDDAGGLLGYVDTTASIDTDYRYYVQAWEPIGSSAHWGELAAPLVVTKQVVPTTLVSKTPAAPDGTNGYYKSKPLISLTSDVTGSTTYYKWDSGSYQIMGPLDPPLVAPEGSHTLYYYSQTQFGLTEAEKAIHFLVDSVPPSTPSLSAAADSETSVRLDWSPSSDGTGSQVAGYRIYRNGVLIDTIAAPLTTYESSSLVPATHYTYTIRSFDVAGNESAWSNTAEATTWDPVVTYLTARVYGSTQTPIVVYNGATSIVATLTSDPGATPLGGQTLAVYSSTVGPTGPWTRTSYVAVSRSGLPGGYIVTVRTTVRTWYQLRFLATGKWAGSASSDTLWIRAKASLSKPYVPTTAYRTRTATVWGKMYPKHASTKGSSASRIYFERYELYAGRYRWRVKFYKYAVLSNSSSWSYTKYSYSLRFPYTGKWRVRAWHSDTGHVAVYGPYSSTITVR